MYKKKKKMAQKNSENIFKKSKLMKTFYKNKIYKNF